VESCLFKALSADEKTTAFYDFIIVEEAEIEFRIIKDHLSQDQPLLFPTAETLPH
jgi:hypothetical protein